jgi:hypothetical protein
MGRAMPEIRTCAKPEQTTIALALQQRKKRRPPSLSLPGTAPIDRYFTLPPFSFARLPPSHLGKASQILMNNSKSHQSFSLRLSVSGLRKRRLLWSSNELEKSSSSRPVCAPQSARAGRKGTSLLFLLSLSQELLEEHIHSLA